MTRVLVLAEGQTEETFFRELLAPHLWDHEVYPQVVLAATKRVKSGGVFRGGIVSYAKVKSDILKLLRDRNAAAVTTMIDYNGLPKGFPGLDTRATGSCYERVAHVEADFKKDVGDHRFVPHLSLHEFEAVLFSSPGTLASIVPDARQRTTAQRELAAIRQGVGCPEEIDEDPTTAPSKRIKEHIVGFQKPLHGALVSARIGLDAIRRECPHFDRWVTWLEGAGERANQQ